MKITELLRRTEGKNLEFKRDLSSPGGSLRTVVAFANTTGGVILIGVEDRTRHIRGVTDPLDLEERVVNLISDSIKPRPLPDVELPSYRNSYVLASPSCATGPSAGCSTNSDWSSSGAVASSA